MLSIMSLYLLHSGGHTPWYLNYPTSYLIVGLAIAVTVAMFVLTIVLLTKGEPEKNTEQTTDTGANPNAD